MKLPTKAVLATLAVICLGFLTPSYISASLYGRGQYGACTYQTDCSISISTSGTVSLDLTPSGTSVYTIADDTVEVTTNSPDGYTLSLEMSGQNTDLAGVSDQIDASNGNTTTPITLSENTWGFRVDAQAGFGPGPTTVTTDQSSTSLTFAGVQALGSPATLKSTNLSTPSGDITDIWYGVRANSSLTSGLYSGQVLYTAVAL